jgi:hypothetical protein
MSPVDPKFLRDVQRSGWLLNKVERQEVTASCPNQGCGLKVALRPGGAIPQACTPHLAMADVAVGSFGDARKILRKRREDLALTIKELEEVAGAAGDHFAKAEKDDPTKIPNAQIFLEWAASLGFAVILRPVAMPPVALRMISDTRQKTEARRTMQPYHRARREGGR